ncbi:helix-turn-helix domain-containing protein [Actinacidiphila sp. ITFR-21]|uniref:helix-turn-helix domain-containing protein n=1 Tax=Actinacidiphila sp. ITFR-21 TaxID=3075199 RepID=UPI00288A3C6F|nr:helix-turn-helix transcriptional regulator [Streptomyces sp. ITFR-21]WNI18132.1 helix-turn-helix transcriptional regulator [Streptomyces sp. ITFR-21]
MAETASGSTVPRRQLGRHLRELRNRARLTVRAAATALEWSDQKLWRIETGQTSMRSLDVEAMCRVYGADAELAAALMGLAKETKGRGWWHAYGDVIPETFDLYIGLEEAAERLNQYSAELVPGLLQTTDYARMLISGDNPGVADEEIERRVHVRTARQALLTRVTRPLTLEVALSEAVLRRPIGGQQVMATQLEHLLELAALPHVSIRVVHYGAGLHHGLMSGPFTMLHFPINGDGQPTEPTTVYVDGFTGDLYLDKPHEIERYGAAFTAIWGSALNDKESQALLHQAARELRQ